MLTDVHVPENIESAVAALRDGGRILAGGTVLMPAVTTAAHDIATLVSLRRAGLAGIDVDEATGAATVGATTTLADLQADPRLAVLAPAVATIASPSVRNLATVGGNLFAEPPHGDLATCLLALDAQVDVAGPDGTRRVGVAEVLADGVADGEIVTAVRCTVPPADEWRFHKAARRRLNSAAVVTVAAHITTEPGTGNSGAGTVTAARIALGGFADRPVRATAAEAALTGRALDADAVADAARAALAAITPRTDAFASDWYRARVLPVHLRRALLGA